MTNCFNDFSQIFIPLIITCVCHTLLHGFSLAYNNNNFGFQLLEPICIVTMILFSCNAKLGVILQSLKNSELRESCFCGTFHIGNLFHSFNFYTDSKGNVCQLLIFLDGIINFSRWNWKKSEGISELLPLQNFETAS